MVYLRILIHITVLLALLQILSSYGVSVSGNGPVSKQCLNCSETAGSCTVHTVNRTIECEVDARSCDTEYCEGEHFCQLSFSHVDNSWKFDSKCFLKRSEDNCNLDNDDPAEDQHIFPPKYLVCQCSGVDECTGPHVYVHPEPSPLSSSPSLSPSPTMGEFPAHI